MNGSNVPHETKSVRNQWTNTETELDDGRKDSETERKRKTEGQRAKKKKNIYVERQYEMTIASSLPFAQISPHHSFGSHKLTTEIKALAFSDFVFADW